MRAIAIERFGGAEELRVTDVPEPLVGPDSVLVSVRAAGVNPVDFKIRSGALAEAIPHLFPLVPGWDVAGVVEAVGPAVTEFAESDEVFGYLRKDMVRDGTYAERVAVRPHQLARKPATLSFEEAAAVPLAGLTALQLLGPGRLDAQRDETVVVLGASGGVGTFAVQIARAGGSRVIGVASEASLDLVRWAGAEETVDYASQDVAEAVLALRPDGVEAVADLVGPEHHEALASTLVEGGRLGSIIAPPDPAVVAARGGSVHYVFVRPEAAGLETLAAMADAGDLRVHLHDVLALEDAGRAHELLEGGGVRGKLVLRVS